MSTVPMLPQTLREVCRRRYCSGLCAAAAAAAAGPAQGSSRDIVNAILLILVNVALSDEIGFCY